MFYNIVIGKTMLKKGNNMDPALYQYIEVMFCEIETLCMAGN